MFGSFATRPSVALLVMMMGAFGNAEDCGTNGKATCQESPDVSEFLQNKVQVAASIESDEGVDDNNRPRQLGEPPITLIEEDVKIVAGEKLKCNVSQPVGGSSICGSGEEVIATTCVQADSLVKLQSKATADMRMGGCCTAWLVKSKDASRGALMLSTGHCGSKTSATFRFDNVNACPSKGVQKPTMVSCTGTRLSVDQTNDEHAIYELEKSCTHVDTLTPIKLDIGTPDVDEGMYLIGHPRCLPQFLSHKEVHDDGHHCEVRSTMSWGGSKRIKYYCDTSGGNSGSPVFSARTGYAFAIHSHGGCSKGQSSANSGGLLDNPGNLAAFQKYGIPYVNRNTVDLFKYEHFMSESVCPDHTDSVDLTSKTEAECKSLCVGSLTCVGFEYMATSQLCTVNYDSTKTTAACQGGAKYYRRTATLMDVISAAPPTTTTAAPPLTGCDGTKDKLKKAQDKLDSAADAIDKILGD